MSGLRPITVITGASAGIGVTLARVFARHGHELALVARREDRLRALADEIEAAGGIKPLGAMLIPRGLLRRKQSAETRACAAMALGKIRTPEARELLHQAAEDKELVVRNAVSRSLRDAPA